MVKDANGVALGALVGFGYGGALTIYKNGYFVTVNPDGTFIPSQIWWSNAGACSGTPYLNDGLGGAGGVPTYYHTVAWSGAGNAWYVVTGTATKNMVTSVEAAGTTSSIVQDPPYAPYTQYTSPDHSIENSGYGTGSFSCDIHQGTSGYGGWTLATFNPQTSLGWPAFTSCNVTDGPNYNGQTSTTTAATTVTNSCLAGPLELP